MNEIKQLILANTDEFGLKSYDEYFKELAVANRFDPAEVIFVKRLLQVTLPEALRKRMADILFEKIVGIEESALAGNFICRLTKSSVWLIVACTLAAMVMTIIG